MDIVHESNVSGVKVHDRKLQWIVSGNSDISSDYFSSCIVEFQPGATAKPPHSHSDCEEAIFILSGSGELLVEGGTSHPIREGSFIVARKDEIHMLRNTGSNMMKAICFFTFPTDNTKYDFHPIESVGMKDD